jgi:hypothetical protein
MSQKKFDDFCDEFARKYTQYIGDLHHRYNDESQYENIDDYGDAIEKHCNVHVTRMMCDPFACYIAYEKGNIRISLQCNQLCFDYVHKLTTRKRVDA